MNNIYSVGAGVGRYLEAGLCTNLNFVNPGTKVNDAYYRLPVMRDVSGEFFIFKKDSAPAHTALTVFLCKI